MIHPRNDAVLGSESSGGQNAEGLKNGHDVADGVGRRSGRASPHGIGLARGTGTRSKSGGVASRRRARYRCLSVESDLFRARLADKASFGTVGADSPRLLGILQASISHDVTSQSIKDWAGSPARCISW